MTSMSIPWDMLARTPPSLSSNSRGLFPVASVDAKEISQVGVKSPDTDCVDILVAAGQSKMWCRTCWRRHAMKRSASATPGAFLLSHALSFHLEAHTCKHTRRPMLTYGPVERACTGCSIPMQVELEAEKLQYDILL
ncbi:hypothetical protein ABBQ38_011882 [Trebouxia sp. C0009 RCD-2024]